MVRIRKILVLWVVLGLALFYAAAQRSRSEAGRARNQFIDIIERSHQGVAVMQGEEMKYANPALLRIYGLPPEGGPQMSTGPKWRDATMPEDERAIARERHRRIVCGELAEDHWEGERRGFDGRRLKLRFSSWKVDWDGVQVRHWIEPLPSDRIHLADHLRLLVA